eukprot:15447834-Alexandrium_andersonii.AAC.1
MLSCAVRSTDARSPYAARACTPAACRGQRCVVSPARLRSCCWSVDRLQGPFAMRPVDLSVAGIS